MTTKMSSRPIATGRTTTGFLRGINIHHPQQRQQYQMNFDLEAPPPPPTPPPMPQQQTMHFLEKPEVDKKVKVHLEIFKYNYFILFYSITYLLQYNLPIFMKQIIIQNI